MEFKTSISKITKEGMIIRGEKLSDLINKNSFTDAIFLLLRKRNPTSVESTLFSAMLISIIDHGMGTTSSMTSRFVMSGGNDLNTSVGAGILALGNYHGGAIEQAMVQLNTLTKQTAVVEQHINELLGNKKIIYGFGHKIYKTEDPRVTQLLQLCKENNYASSYIDLALQIELLIEKIKGKKICLNIDGLLAAILLEMGFSPLVGKGIFIIGRTPGLVAQSIEEREKEKPVRRIDEDSINYEPEN